jgi:hypothetical protein
MDEAMTRRWMAEPTSQVPDPPYEGQHEVMSLGGKANLHVAYVRSGELARHIVEAHNFLIDRKERREMARMAPGPAARARFAQRWQVDGATVETVDGVMHVATVGTRAVAEHIAELHNRTFGDGQDPPPSVELNGELDARVWAEQFHRHLAGGKPTDVGTLISWFANAIQTGVDSERNKGVVDDFHAALAEMPAPGAYTRHQPAGRDTVRNIAGEIESLIETEVRARVAVYAAREPARIVIDNDPVAMANVLRMMGYTVTTPSDARAASDNLAQDIAEQVPGAVEARAWFDSAPSEKDAGGLYDFARRAFLAGYRAGRDTS